MNLDSRAFRRGLAWEGRSLLATSSSSPNGPRHSHRRSDFVRPQYRLREHSWGQQLPGRTGGGAPNTLALPSRGAGGSPSGSWEGWGGQLWSSRMEGWPGDATKPEHYIYAQMHTHTHEHAQILHTGTLINSFLFRCRAALTHIYTRKPFPLAWRQPKADCGPLNTSTDLLIPCFGHTSGVPSVSLPPTWQVVPLPLWREQEGKEGHGG